MGAHVKPADVRDSELSPVESEFSLIVGAPFWKLLRRLKIIDHDRPLPERRIICLLFLTWIPLLVFTIKAGTALGNSVRISLLQDFSLYGRLVVALPILILAEVVIDPGLRRVASTFRSSGIVKDTDLPAYRSMLAKVERLRDSGWAEAILFLFACFPFFLFVEEESLSSSNVTTWYRTPAGFSPAGWWYLLVSTPIARFILVRWLWRYALWCTLLSRIARLDLNMMPTHPDQVGGLGFVVRAHRRFDVLATALGSVLAGVMVNSILYLGDTLKSMRTEILVFIVLAILFVLGPLLAISPKLSSVRRRGLEEYGQVARSLAEGFHSKWIRGHRGEEEALMSSPDPSALADYSTCFNTIRDMQFIPITREPLIQVAALAGLPFLIVVLVGTPIEQIVAWIFKMFL